jgi:hypothetical protein
MERTGAQLNFLFERDVRRDSRCTNEKVTIGSTGSRINIQKLKSHCYASKILAKCKKERATWCEHCQHFLYDQSGLTQDQLLSLIWFREGVRPNTIYLRTDGLVQALDCPNRYGTAKKLGGAFLVVLGICFALCSATPGVGHRDAVRETEIMNGVAGSNDDESLAPQPDVLSRKPDGTGSDVYQPAGRMENIVMNGRMPDPPSLPGTPVDLSKP